MEKFLPGNIMLFSHDAPFLTITDRVILDKFLTRHNIDCSVDKALLMHKIADAFSKIPYENLTKILKSDGVINVRSAMRYPDELIGDYLRWGTGGTCFSLTAAIIAVYNACGIEAHPVLADRHYGVDTHCGLILVTAAGVHLLDPGYLLFIPTLLPSLGITSVNTGYNTIELVPLPGGEKLELYTVVKGNRKLRLVYKTAPVSAERFENAWETSFKWEMMTYPVLTRVSAGQHQYIQGNKLSIRTDEKTHRMELTTENEVDYIANNLGLNREIVKKAFGVINNGRH